MKIFECRHKQRLKYFSFSLVVVFAMLLPYVSYCQDEQQEGDEELGSGTNFIRPGERPTSNGGNTTRWETVRRPVNGARADYNSTATTRPAGSAARPGGATVDLVDPGGPPDVEVPFDDNMNLIFLAGAIAFAFWAVRKRLTAKPVTLKNEE